MSSKYSVCNFSKNQKIMQAASTALDTYNFVGLLWAVGVTLMLWGSYGRPGLAWGVITNLAVLVWINASYIQAFKRAAKQNGVKVPRCLFGLYNPHNFPADFETNPRYKHMWGDD